MKQLKTLQITNKRSTTGIQKGREGKKKDKQPLTFEDESMTETAENSIEQFLCSAYWIPESTACKKTNLVKFCS